MALATLPAATEEDSGKPLFPANCATAFYLVTALFLLWGIANNLNGLWCKWPGRVGYSGLWRVEDQR